MKNTNSHEFLKQFFLLLVLLLLPVTKSVAAPIITSPTPGSTLTQSIQTFSWSANGTTGITQWYLYIGTTGVASRDIYAGSQNTNTSASISGLPTNGGTINFRLWYRTTNWQFVDVTYTACNACTPSAPIVSMTSPTNGSTFTQPSQIFNWQVTNGTVSQYYLYIGTTGVASRNILSASQGTNTQATVNNLPTNGSTVYVRLWYYIGSWKFKDYTYTSCSGCTASPVITVQKTSVVISDGVNSSNPKRIPGAVVEYTITATNSGSIAADNNSVSINDAIPSNLDIDMGSIQFIDGTPSSGLTLGNINAASSTFGHIDYISVMTLGQFLAPSGSGNPSFQVKFRATLR